MAKVKRSVLKEIVKECLLEILFEGIDSEPGYEEDEPIREARQTRRTSRPSPKRSERRSLHAAVQERQQAPKSRRPPRKDHINEAVGELTDDPMMASIFADTASTTFQEQKEGARPVAGDAASQVVAGSDDMEDLFEGASNWAAIAFNEVDN